MEITERSLVKKLCRIMSAVGYLQKTGENTAQKYKYATEADVAEMMRKELAKENVFIFPNVVRNDRTRIERPGYNPGEVKVSYATDVEIDWTFMDGDSGETFVCRIPGSSETPGDKGVYVAMTGSEKYLLMKGFLIPTGDDPESDDNEPRGTKEDAKAVGEKRLAEYQAREREQLLKKDGATPHGTSSSLPQAAPLPQDGDFNASAAAVDQERINTEVFGGQFDANEDIPEGFESRKAMGLTEIMVAKNMKKFFKVQFGPETVTYWMEHSDDSTHAIFAAHSGEELVMKIDRSKPAYPKIVGILKIGTADLTKLEK